MRYYRGRDTAYRYTHYISYDILRSKKYLAATEEILKGCVSLNELLRKRGSFVLIFFGQTGRRHSVGPDFSFVSHI